jgi:hypothetical protein
VLYVAGWARSGSTLLGNLLGHLDECFFAGEVRFLGEKAWRENRLCGCGRPMLDCDLWAEIRSRLERRVGHSGLSLLETVFGSQLKTRSYLRPVLPIRDRPLSQLEERALPVLEGLYQEMAAVSGASVIVDTSKAPMYARLLTRVPGIRLDVVHLLRDPRATAFSLKKRRYDSSSKVFMSRVGLVRNSLLWGTWNLAAERLASRSAPSVSTIRIRYEDFAKEPVRVLRSIGAFAGLAGDLPHVTAQGRVHLKPNHSGVGNPNRMNSGATTIAIDREWAADMSWRDRAITVLLTWPLLLRYGYRVVP